MKWEEVGRTRRWIGLCGNFDFGGKETWALRNSRFGSFIVPSV